MTSIENDFMKISTSEMGAELISIYDKEKMQDVLWNGDPRFWKYHSPVLFPFVGRVNGGKYRHHGIEYFMPAQHGFARTSRFTLCSRTEDSVTYALESDAETEKIYPFQFRLEITYKLEVRNVRVLWNVINLSECHHMYFSIGAHPAFRLPIGPGRKKSDFFIHFEGTEEPRYILMDLKASAADPGRRYTMETDHGYVRIRDHMFDIDTYIFEKGQIEDISLCYPDRTPFVTVHCPHFPYFGIWSPSDEAPFVCLEPWFGRADDRGFDGGMSEKTGIQVLPPLSSFRENYIIEVNE